VAGSLGCILGTALDQTSWITLPLSGAAPPYILMVRIPPPAGLARYYYNSI
jgi:hypothetical protein